MADRDAGTSPRAVSFASLLLGVLLLAAGSAAAKPDDGGQAEQDGQPDQKEGKGKEGQHGQGQETPSQTEGKGKDDSNGKGQGPGQQESQGPGPSGEARNPSPSPSSPPQPSPPSAQPGQEDGGAGTSGPPSPSSSTSPSQEQPSNAAAGQDPSSSRGQAADPSQGGQRPSQASSQQPGQSKHDTPTPGAATAADGPIGTSPSGQDGPRDQAPQPAVPPSSPSASPSLQDPALLPAATPPSAGRDITQYLDVSRSAQGNRLHWDPPPREKGETGGQGVAQVWRLEEEWRLVGALAPGSTSFVDAGAPQDARYKLTWSLEALDPLAPAALQVPDWDVGLHQASGDGPSSALGLWGLGSLWGAVALLGMVRSAHPGPGPASGLLRQADETPLRILFRQLPGVDLSHIERLDQLGFRTVGQLRALDADAVAFWANVEPAKVREWRDLAALLQWPALAPGSSRWLAQAGLRSILHLATAPASDLAVAVRSGPSLTGAPFDLGELRHWRRLAQAFCGLPEDREDDALLPREAPEATPAPTPIGLLQASSSPL